MTPQGDYFERTLKYSYVLTCLRDLIVYLDRGNRVQAESTLAEVARHLGTILVNPGNADTERVQPTFFAVDEVRMLLSQKDFNGALAAARDAAREWKKQSRRQNSTETA